MVRLFQSKIKQLEASKLPTLTSTTDELKFQEWLDSFEDILDSVGLGVLTYIDKGATIPTTEETKTLNDNLRTTSLYKQIFGQTAKGMIAQVTPPSRNEKISPEDRLTYSCLYLTTLDTFPELEKFVFLKIKSSLSNDFKHIMPKKFYPGTLCNIYMGMYQEFRRPNYDGLFARKTKFLAGKDFEIKHGDDPRLVATAIEEEAHIINGIFNGDYVTEIDKIMILRNSAMKVPAYARRIKDEDDNNRTTLNFRSLRMALEKEYLNYIKSKNHANTVHANLADSSENTGPDYFVHPKFNEDNSDIATAMWVKVPKGCCLQYGIKGKCTRDNCDYKHVEGETVDTPPQYKRRLNSDNKRAPRSGRFSSNNYQKSDPKDFKRSKNKKNQKALENIGAHLMQLIENSSSSSSESENVTSCSPEVSENEPNDVADPPSDDQKGAQAFLSALAARFKPKKFAHKTNKNFRPKHPKKHPNNKSFIKKMDELRKKEKSQLKQDKVNLVKALMGDRRFQLNDDELPSSESE